MGTVRTQPPVLLIVATTAAPEVTSEAVAAAVEQALGPIAEASEEFDFSAFTSFYEREMGRGLRKWLWVFREPIARETLPDTKLATNEIERTWCREGRRRANIDPGYLTPLALVLATTKPAHHRIYLRDGIHAESTLRYMHGAYYPWDWTYPDYRQPLVAAFLARWRPAAIALATRHTAAEGDECPQ